MGEALVADGVRKEYPGTVALRDVSLSVDAGEVFALVGPNGAGKTTLVRALTGTTTPTDGDVSLFGRDPAAVAKSRVGLLPQDFSPPGRLTVGELLRYYAGLYDDARAPSTVIDEVGLETTADTWYENLSGGQRRRACLGAALVNDPEVLFLDEPTAGIDPVGRRTVREHVASLAAGGATVFLTTHDLAEAERLADRVGVLVDGRLRAVDSPGALVRAHGGEDRLVVETAADPAVLSDLDGRVERRGDSLVVHGVAPPEVGRVVDRLEERGVEYDQLTWTRPDLEDAYLALTDGGGERPASDARAAVAGGGR